MEHGNDSENLVVAQIHLSFSSSRLVDQAVWLDDRDDHVVDEYRYVVLDDYLPQIVGRSAVEAALKQPVNNGFYQPGTDTRSPRWNSLWQLSGSVTPRSATSTPSTTNLAACRSPDQDAFGDVGGLLAMRYGDPHHRLRQLLQ